MNSQSWSPIPAYLSVATYNNGIIDDTIASKLTISFQILAISPGVQVRVS